MVGAAKPLDAETFDENNPRGGKNQVQTQGASRAHLSKIEGKGSPGKKLRKKEKVHPHRGGRRIAAQKGTRKSHRKSKITRGNDTWVNWRGHGCFLGAGGKGNLV